MLSTWLLQLETDELERYEFALLIPMAEPYKCASRIARPMTGLIMRAYYINTCSGALKVLLF